MQKEKKVTIPTRAITRSRLNRFRSLRKLKSLDSAITTLLDEDDKNADKAGNEKGQ